MTLPKILDMSPDVMSSAEVDAELQLCSCLVSWVRWDAPTELVNSNLAAIRSPTTVRHCMLREQVVGDMIWEAANADTLPPRLQYNAASRYPRKKAHLAPARHDAKSTYSVATEALATHSLIDLSLITKALSKPCEKARRSHTCMDVFRSDPCLACDVALPPCCGSARKVDSYDGRFLSIMAGQWNTLRLGVRWIFNSG